MIEQSNPGVSVKHAILEQRFYLKIRDEIFGSAQLSYFPGSY